LRKLRAWREFGALAGALERGSQIGPIHVHSFTSIKGRDPARSQVRDRFGLIGDRKHASE